MQSLCLWEAKFPLTDTHVYKRTNKQAHTHKRTCARIYTRPGWARCPPGIGAGMLKLLRYRVRGLIRVTHKVYKFWVLG